MEIWKILLPGLAISNALSEQVRHQMSAYTRTKNFGLPVIAQCTLGRALQKSEYQVATILVLTFGVVRVFGSADHFQVSALGHFRPNFDWFCSKMLNGSNASQKQLLTLAEVQSWKMEALKDYCRKRNLKVSVGKLEHVARIFAASEMGIQIQPTAQELIAKASFEKSKLLEKPNITLPDPFNLNSGWLKEKDGLTSWLTIFLSDLTVFPMSEHP